MKSQEQEFTPGNISEHRSYCDAALAPVFELNLFLLEMLTQVSADGAFASPGGLARTLKTPLNRLTSDARNTLARCPIALVDAGFRDEAQWVAVITRPDGGFPTHDSAFPHLHAVQLAHQALTLAWTVARASPENACIIFGMTAKCAHLVARAGLQVIQRVAGRHPNLVRPAWEDQPEIWNHLITMAMSPQPRLPSVGLRALQRRLADLEPATRETGETRSTRR